MTGITLVIIQGIASWFDGYFSQTQLQRREIEGWAFIEHGGMWSDVFIISPLVAYIVSNYRVEYFSEWGLFILAMAIALSLAMGMMYQKNGKTTPEAHTHDGKTMIAGWIHGLFAVVAIWTCALFYLGRVSPSPSVSDTLIVSLFLTPFFYLGVVKFNDRWVFDPFAQWQVGVLTLGLWVLTGIRIWNS